MFDTEGEEYDVGAPTLKGFIGWSMIKLKILDDNGFAIQKGYDLHVMMVKDGVIYAFPQFEPS